MATFRKRGGRWQVMVRRNGYPAESRTFTLKADAEAWSRQVETRIDRGDIACSERALRSVTLGELLTRYAATVTPSKKGSGPELYRLKKMQADPIAGASLDRCTSDLFARYRDRRLSQVSKDSVRRELAILSHCFEVARIEWAVPLATNPISVLAKPAPGKGRERRLEGDDWTRLLEALRRTRNPELGDIIRFAVHTAMRRSEILAIRWSDLDPNRGGGRPRTGKLAPDSRRIF